MFGEHPVLDPASRSHVFAGLHTLVLESLEGDQGWKFAPKIKTKKKQNQVRERVRNNKNGKDAVFFCNKKSKWKIKNELKIVQKEENFIRKSQEKK